MNGRPGRPGTPGSGPSRQSGGYRPSSGYRPRRPGGSGGNSDNVLPLITGVLGSSILAFSLYVFSHKPGILGDIVQGNDDFPSVSPEPAAPPPAIETCHQAEDYLESYENYETVVEEGPAQHNHSPKISIEKKKWLSEQEQETLKERRLKEKQVRGKLQKELSEHLKKVKEIRDELHREKKP